MDRDQGSVSFVFAHSCEDGGLVWLSEDPAPSCQRPSGLKRSERWRSSSRQYEKLLQSFERSIKVDPIDGIHRPAPLSPELNYQQGK
jgi:hypothetical protein